MTVKAYYNTGFDAVNIPCSPSMLENVFSNQKYTWTDVNISQSEWEANVILDNLRPHIARQIDYVIIDDDDVVGGKKTCYTVKNFQEVSDGVIKLNLLLDPYNTMGGFLYGENDNEVLEGSAERLTVPLTKTGVYTLADGSDFFTLPEPFSPATPVRINVDTTEPTIGPPSPGPEPTPPGPPSDPTNIPKEIIRDLYKIEGSSTIQRYYRTPLTRDIYVAETYYISGETKTDFLNRYMSFVDELVSSTQYNPSGTLNIFDTLLYSYNNYACSLMGNEPNSIGCILNYGYKTAGSQSGTELNYNGNENTWKDSGYSLPSALNISELVSYSGYYLLCYSLITYVHQKITPEYWTYKYVRLERAYKLDGTLIGEKIEESIS